MKKTISIIMALALAATLSTVVFAAEADDGNIKKNISVKAKYVTKLGACEKELLCYGRPPRDDEKKIS